MLMLVFLIGFDLALKDCVVTVFSGDEFDDELDEDSSCSSSFFWILIGFGRERNVYLCF